MARRVYRSRLARKENKKMLRQSGLLLVLTVGAVLAIIFWGVPALIEFAGFLGEVNNTNKPVEERGGIGPFAPQLAIPYEATSSARITIDGFSRADTSVLLFNGGVKVAEVFAEEDGSFSFSRVALEVGENEFSAQAVDQDGNESALSRTRVVLFDNQAPGLEIESPDDGNEYFGSANQRIDVRGVTEPRATVFVNGRRTSANVDGEFDQSVSLTDGENDIEVRVVDQAGNETQKSLKVRYSR